MNVGIVADYMLRFIYRVERVFSMEFKCHSDLTTNCRFACQVRRLSHIDFVNGFQSRIHGGTIIFYDLLLYASGKSVCLVLFESDYVQIKLGWLFVHYDCI